MKALVGAFNQEKALVGAFSVIVQPVMEPMEHSTARSELNHLLDDEELCTIKGNCNEAAISNKQFFQGFANASFPSFVYQSS